MKQPSSSTIVESHWRNATELFEGRILCNDNNNLISTFQYVFLTSKGVTFYRNHSHTFLLSCSPVLFAVTVNCHAFPCVAWACNPMTTICLDCLYMQWAVAASTRIAPFDSLAATSFSLPLICGNWQWMSYMVHTYKPLPMCSNLWFGWHPCMSVTSAFEKTRQQPLNSHFLVFAVPHAWTV